MGQLIRFFQCCFAEDYRLFNLLGQQRCWQHAHKFLPPQCVLYEPLFWIEHSSSGGLEREVARFTVDDETCRNLQFRVCLMANQSQFYKAVSISTVFSLLAAFPPKKFPQKIRDNSGHFKQPKRKNEKCLHPLLLSKQHGEKTLQRGFLWNFMIIMLKYFFVQYNSFQRAHIIILFYHMPGALTCQQDCNVVVGQHRDRFDLHNRWSEYIVYIVVVDHKMENSAPSFSYCSVCFHCSFSCSKPSLGVLSQPQQVQRGSIIQFSVQLCHQSCGFKLNFTVLDSCVHCFSDQKIKYIVLYIHCSSIWIHSV